MKFQPRHPVNPADAKKEGIGFSGLLRLVGGAALVLGIGVMAYRITGDERDSVPSHSGQRLSQRLRRGEAEKIVGSQWTEGRKEIRGSGIPAIPVVKERWAGVISESACERENRVAMPRGMCGAGVSKESAIAFLSGNRLRKVEERVKTNRIRVESAAGFRENPCG
jgi:hypothetical protein